MVQNLDNEIWKDVIGYEDCYMVSNFGRIKSLVRKNVTKEKVMVLIINKDGYIHVPLSVNGKYKTGKVQRMVALAFIPNPENKRTVNHKDGNRSNNSVENLEWATDSEQQIHSYNILNKKPTWLGKKMGVKPLEQNGKMSRTKREKNGNGGYIVNTQTGIFYETITEAANAAGINRRTLTSMLNNTNYNRSNFLIT